MVYQSWLPPRRVFWSADIELYLEDIVADTIHSAFHIPIGSDVWPTVKWNLANHDIFLVDEVSMVPGRIICHVLNSVHQLVVCPITVFCGDEYQQQPIDMVDKRTVHVENILPRQKLLCPHCANGPNRTT